MRFEYNSRFKDLQEIVEIDFVERMHHNKTYTDLGELVELYEVDGCVFIHNLPEYRSFVDLEYVERCYQDRTGYEVAENHILLHELFEPAMSLKEKLKFSLSYLCALFSRMKLQFPNLHFQGTLTFVQDDDITVCFHVLRPGEPPFPNMELEDAEGAVFVVSN